MTRASISISPPNDAWIKAQIDSEEFSSRSEVVNDLIRKARKAHADIEYISIEQMTGEKSGASKRTPEDLINAVFDKRRKNGTL